MAVPPVLGLQLTYVSADPVTAPRVLVDILNEVGWVGQAGWVGQVGWVVQVELARSALPHGFSPLPAMQIHSRLVQASLTFHAPCFSLAAGLCRPAVARTAVAPLCLHGCTVPSEPSGKHKSAYWLSGVVTACMDAVCQLNLRLETETETRDMHT